jgi:hypothetical protein
MLKRPLWEYLAAFAVGSVVVLIAIWAFESRERNGPRNIIVEEKNGIKIYSAAGDTYTVSTIKFVDKDGNSVITINAGPPPTIDIVDEKGRTKSIDLRKLASRASFFGDSNE